MIISSKDTGRSQRFLTVYNGSGETIPAFAAMEPYGVDAEGNILVRKPTQDDSNRVLINAGAIIGDGDYGTGTNHMAMWAYYSTADGTPVTGESIGTKAGEWKLFRGYEGFLVWGGAGNFGVDIIQVQRDLTCRSPSHGFYYPNDDPCGATCCCWRCGPAAQTDPTDLTGFTGPTSLHITVTNSCIGTASCTLNLTSCGCIHDPGVAGPDVITWTGDSGDSVTGAYAGLDCNGNLVNFNWLGPSLTATVKCISSGGSGRLFYVNISHQSTDKYVQTCGASATTCFAIYSGGEGSVGGYFPLRFTCTPFFGYVTGSTTCNDAGVGNTCNFTVPFTTLIPACVGSTGLVLVTL